MLHTSALALALAACSTSMAAQARDVHSHARPDEVRVTHVALDLELDFDARLVRGSVELALARADRAAPLVLDVDGLVITAVRGRDGSARAFELGPRDEQLGAPLVIALEPDDERVRVDYRTTPDSAALLWLAPEQTAGRHPFLFTQGQSIFTRTWIPLQDSPGVRVTYEARVRAPKPLTVLMSAAALARDDDGAFRFRMDQPIPPYLIALAAGQLAFRAISARAGVWAQPSLVDAARNELEDTEAMIAAAEKLFGPYRWERYDLLILPPAFPFGGMENPRLTFATPTILAGDKSLVALVAHELAHSWSGNLVTNATWGDFWLNEGFTVYLEQRIMEAVFGVERALAEQQLARTALEHELEELDDWQEHLAIELAGKHPDEGFSGVPYDKGAFFLRRLEKVLGRADLDAFLAGYFERFAFQSITTAAFERYLVEQRPALTKAVDLDLWLRGPGLPADAPRAHAASLAAVDAARARWLAGEGEASLGAQAWTTQQWLRFLEGLSDALEPSAMARLDAAFGLTQSGNAEVLCVWLRLAIEHEYAPADERLEAFLMTVGRAKFLTPLYTALARTEAGHERANAIFARARPRYHAWSTRSIEKVLARADEANAAAGSR